MDRRNANRARLRAPVGSAVAAGLLMLGGVGCGALTPGSLKASAPKVYVARSSAVSVSYREVMSAASKLNANGSAYEIDRNAFSAELAALLEDSLRGAGVDTKDDAKRLEVQVDYLDFMFQGPCLLDYRVYLGDAEPFGMQSEGDSGLFTTACRKALEYAVEDIASDERVRTYMEKE